MFFIEELPSPFEMKNVVESITVSLRFPQEMLNEMDTIIAKSGRYANRPDFIISAIRYYDAFLIQKAAFSIDYLIRAEPDFRELGLELLQKHNETEGQKEYEKYKGESRLVTIRTPPGLAIIKRTLRDGLLYIDFARIAVAMYIKAFNQDEKLCHIIDVIVPDEREMPEEMMEQKKKIATDILKDRGLPSKV